MVDRQPDFFPERVKMRVPSMSGLAGVTDSMSRLMRVEFGTPATSSRTAISTFTSSTAAQTITTGLPVTIAAKWGRCLIAIGNGTGTYASTVVGRDYLGQKVTETISISSTIASGAKAFKYVDYIVSGSGANAVNTDALSVGFGDRLGLPYSAVAIVASFMNGVTAGAHTLVTPDTTDPATAATTDPRGYVALSTAANGTRTFAALLEIDTANMHGVASV